MNLTMLQDEIQEAIPKLLEIARGLTWNNISDNCRFILTEIKDNQDNYYNEWTQNKKMNDKKIPLSLPEFMPLLINLYDNFYDINLHIYRAKKNITIIDFRYYPKSSLDKEYREKVLYNPPMIHCKVSLPPWLSDKKEKFDINWEHYVASNRIRLSWMKLKLKTIKQG